MSYKAKRKPLASNNYGENLTADETWMMIQWRDWQCVSAILQHASMCEWDICQQKPKGRTWKHFGVKVLTAKFRVDWRDPTTHMRNPNEVQWYADLASEPNLSQGHNLTNWKLLPVTKRPDHLKSRRHILGVSKTKAKQGCENCRLPSNHCYKNDPDETELESSWIKWSFILQHKPLARGSGSSLSEFGFWNGRVTLWVQHTETKSELDAGWMLVCFRTTVEVSRRKASTPFPIWRQKSEHLQMVVLG